MRARREVSTQVDYNGRSGVRVGRTRVGIVYEDVQRPLARITGDIKLERYRLPNRRRSID